MTVSTAANPKPAVCPNRPAPTIDGGYIILRRDRRTRRYTMLGHRPFEHGSQQEAEAQAAIMAERYGDEFTVLQQVATIFPPVAYPKIIPASSTTRHAATAEVEATHLSETSPPKLTLEVDTKRGRAPCLEAMNRQRDRQIYGPVKTSRPTIRLSKQPPQSEG